MTANTTTTTHEGEITIGRRTLQVVKTTARLAVSWVLVEADGTEWAVTYSPRRAGQGVFRGDYVAVNRETGKRLQKQGKVARIYVHNGKLSPAS